MERKSDKVNIFINYPDIAPGRGLFWKRFADSAEALL